MAAFVNESPTDRVVRLALGVVLLLLGWTGVVPGLLGVAFKILGFVPLVTGLLGWCPFYAVFGIRTCERRRTTP